MAALELKLLDEFAVRDGAGRPIDIAARKNRALLAALALSPSGSMPREVLAGLLWSDRGEAQARSSLRQALKGLRKDLAEADESLLSVTHARIGLDLDRVDVDAVAFQRHAASSEVGALRQAAALYRGDFLADTYIRDPAFEEWLARQRQRLADLAIKVLEKLSAHETGSARIDIGKRLIVLDPLRESSQRLLMQAYWEVGEVALALRQYQLCQELLGNELEVAPGEETEALRQLILSREPVHAGPPQTRIYGQQGHIGDAGLDPEIPSIAVLPFDSLGGNPELDLFAEALTEDVSTDLARIAAIRVIARNTMFAYKHRPVDVRTVGAEVGARYVLEGSARWSAGRVRVAAQLIEAASGHPIWAERIDRAGFELFDLQDEITQAIVASVQTADDPARRQGSRSRRDRAGLAAARPRLATFPQPQRRISSPKSSTGAACP